MQARCRAQTAARREGHHFGSYRNLQVALDWQGMAGSLGSVHRTVALGMREVLGREELGLRLKHMVSTVTAEQATALSAERPADMMPGKRTVAAALVAYMVGLAVQESTFISHSSIE